MNTSPVDETKPVARTLGLAASIFIFIGYIVGASIFIMPGTLGALTGPGLFIAYLLAALPAAVSCAVAAVVGSAFPEPAAGFALAKKILPPVFVAQGMWLTAVTVAIVTPLVALGFADYCLYFFPNLNRQLIAITVVVAFTVINTLGVSIAASVQGLLVVVFCTALLLFGVGGVLGGSWENMVPLFPMGFTPIFSVSMTVYLSYLGTLVVMEMAGEIKHPDKNIPLTLLVGFSVIVSIYVLVPIALMMTSSWDDLGGSAAIALAAEKFFPPWMATFIAISALLASGTSINGPLMAQSRDILFGAREGFFPKYFSKVTLSSQVPSRAIVLLGTLTIISILFGASIKDYADMVVMSVMYIYAGLGYIALRFPAVLPEIYKNAPFKYPLYLHNLLCIILIVTSLLVLIWLAKQNLIMFVGLLIYILFSSIIFKIYQQPTKNADPCI